MPGRVGRLKTLGIDLASDPLRTGLCIVEWGSNAAEVIELAMGADDAQLLARYRRTDATGIDAPFGWPSGFVAAMRHARSWGEEPWSPQRRDELRFRITDARVRQLVGWWPLSVSSDLIAVPAFRCAGLLEQMGVRDRSGDGRVFETYPAAGLKAWDLPHRGYKGARGRAAREALWLELEQRAPWLHLRTADRLLVLDRDDALDALAAALIVRAATLGLTVLPTEAETRWARTEGWIHVPKDGSLDGLVPG